MKALVTRCVCVSHVNMSLALRTLLAKLKTQLNEWGYNTVKNVSGSAGTQACSSKVCLHHADLGF